MKLCKVNAKLLKSYFQKAVFSGLVPGRKLVKGFNKNYISSETTA